MNESEVREFWNAHPCGDHIVGGLHGRFVDDYQRFFTAYDAWRYLQEPHIPACLDRIEWRGRTVLEIGLGQGAESEQIIRRGGRWSGLDLTQESVDRVRARLELRSLPFNDLQCGSALHIPWPDGTFDVVFSHGVLHHIPDIRTAQSEIHRVLQPGGVLVAMLYARRSLNYQLSIRVVRRVVLALAYPLRRTRLLGEAPPILRQHLENAEREGLRRYLQLDNFTHRSTDGPLNPYARVYSPREVVAEFPDFELVDAFTRYMHAPPLPVRWLPAQSWLGWHLWVQLRARRCGRVDRTAALGEAGPP
ncbi:MAG: class I SAM-dependent methyltransferase [Pseudonocardiaceae bacterium]